MERELKRSLIANPDLRAQAPLGWRDHERADKRAPISKSFAQCIQTWSKSIRFQLTDQRVVLSGSTEDGELVSARKMRSAEKSGDTPQ